MLDILIPSSIITTIIVLIIITISMVKEKNFSVLKFYLTIVTTVSILGFVIAAGAALYQWMLTLMVTDAEYMAWNGMYYEVQNCEIQPSPVYNYVDVKGTVPVDPAQPKQKTPEEIAKCKADAETRIINQRHFQTKDSMIGWLVRGFLFLILFATHFPYLLKTRNEPHEA